MPKVNNTKFQKSLELRRLVKDGPSFSFDTFGANMDTFGLSREQREAIQADFDRSYQIWASTWVAPLVEELVPQLKVK